MSRVHRVPPVAEVHLEPRAEIHRRGDGRYPDVAEIARAISRRERSGNDTASPRDARNRGTRRRVPDALRTRCACCAPADSRSEDACARNRIRLALAPSPPALRRKAATQSPSSGPPRSSGSRSGTRSRRKAVAWIGCCTAAGLSRFRRPAVLDHCIVPESNSPGRRCEPAATIAEAVDVLADRHLRVYEQYSLRRIVD